MAKKILFINTTFTKGGAAQIAQDLFHYVNKNGIDGHFAYGRGEKVSEEKTFYFGNKIETLVHVFLVRFLGLEGYGNYFSTRKLISFIKKEKFDAIHLHNVHGYYLNYYKLFGFLNQYNVPIIWTLHDAWILTSLRAHENYKSYPTTYNKLFLNIFLNKKRRIISGLKNLTIVPSAQWLGEKLQDSYLKDSNIKVIRNGVNIDLFKPSSHKSELRKKYNLSDDKKIVLFSAANLESKNKGFEFILKVAALLEKDNYLFLGVGSGTLKGGENVKTIDYIEDKSVLAEFFILSDLFCITSQSETFPLVVLEAFASGLPVVGFDIIALRELVNKEVGTLVTYGDTDMLSRAIVQNLEQNQKSQNARNLVVNNFSETKFFENYLDIYRGH